MNRKQYIKELAQEIIQANQPLIDRIVNQEVDKIKAQLASLAPNMADRRKMLAVMGTNSSLGVYLANVDKLQGHESDIATNAFTASQQAPNPRDYFDGNLDEFTRQYFDGNLDDFTRQYFDGDDLVNKSIREYFDGSDEFNRRLDDYFHMGE
ncbi:hypothetical protein [Escherichia coli]|uniref:hypothetical protein n=1 Tax=Escherichia coli TaxID=562 RepID=UPI000B42C45C|nr:hypothetical protein [Escherichia coli]EES9824690.1 hypothetical protein [Escherichia coli]EEX9035863.1 hypothetical protein [Escherichia coli]EFC1939422.1 hypothetical protein [Escherichia coli]OWE09375.1 hypothetical protein A8M49_08060 [Escherichia coli]QMB80985.1 hypothetical protein HVZ92_02075 [Escherichia coli]